MGRLLVLVLCVGCRGLLGIEAGSLDADAAPADGPSVDTPADAANDLDPDHDGVGDPADNCPAIPNPQQQNFDGDSFGDACDPCPHLSGAVADADIDNDGVGAACDPRPLIGGDQRVLFVTFDDAADITGWSATVPSWSVDNGTLDQTVADTTSMITLPGTLGDGYFAASANITGIGGAPYIGICSKYTATAFLCCDLHSGSQQIAVAISDNMEAGSVWISSAYVAGTHIEFEQRTDASGFRCTWREAGMMREQTLSAARPDGNLALHVRSTAARFDYVFFARVP